MSEQPGFLRKYSKQEHSDERREAAAQIREARAERQQSDESSEIENVELGKEASQVLESYKALDTEITSLADSGVPEVRDLANYVEVRQRLGTQRSEVPPQFSKPKELLDNFYKRERERWANTKGSLEDAKELFTEKHLASLPMDQYALLLKRFPSAMVTHVTRQGIRDHTGMWEHSAGKGEFSDGFMKMLESGELKSPLAVAAVENGKEEAVAKAIKIGDAANQEEAKEKLEESLSGRFDSYADRAAVHVATEAVADHFYGSERGNEIFVAFPSAHIAAEHQFIGSLADAGDLKHNDTWILKEDGLDKGMDINAGVVFIPAEARVDPETGSRYETGHNSRMPVENDAAREQIKALLLNEEVLDWAEQELYSDTNREEQKKVLEERFGVEDTRLQDAFFKDLREIKMMKVYKKEYSPEEHERRMTSYIDTTLEKASMRYVEAKSTVSSKEFWEAHFAQHPEQRPSKIEYYKGDDPTGALLNWKKKNGLTDSGTESSYDLGGRTDAETYSSADKDRFRSIAEKVISERSFNENNVVDAGEIRVPNVEDIRANALDELVASWKKSGKGEQEKMAFDRMWEEAHVAGLLDDAQFNDAFSKAMTGRNDYNAFRG